MVKVEFLGPLAKASQELEAVSLKEVSTALKKDTEIASWLDKCAVAVNDTMVSDINTPLKSGDKVSILPPVCGG